MYYIRRVGERRAAASIPPAPSRSAAGFGVVGPLAGPVAGGRGSFQPGPRIVERCHGTHGARRGRLLARGASRGGIAPRGRAAQRAAAEPRPRARRGTSRISGSVRSKPPGRFVADVARDAADGRDVDRAAVAGLVAPRRVAVSPPALPPLRRSPLPPARRRAAGAAAASVVAPCPARRRPRPRSARAAAQAPDRSSERSRRSPVRSSRTTRRSEIRSRLATPPRERGGPAPTPARSVSTRRCAADRSLRQRDGVGDGRAQLAVAPQRALARPAQRCAGVRAWPADERARDAVARAPRDEAASAAGESPPAADDVDGELDAARGAPRRAAAGRATDAPPGGGAAARR